MKTLTTLFLLTVLAFLTGCASKQSGSIVPGADLNTVKKFYVVRLPADNRGVEKLIVQDLVGRGYVATSGEAVNVPADVDAVVTYQDKWMWDITMYMIQLDIQLRKPSNDMPLASGSSMRTSLKRKAPAAMVKEVLDQIYAQFHPSTTPAMGDK